MTNRFAFLAKDYNEIHQYCSFIEGYKYNSPSASLGQARNALEKILIRIDVNYNYGDLCKGINRIKDYGDVPFDIVDLMHKVRLACNNGGSHPNWLPSDNEIDTITEALIEICIWFVLDYEGKNYDLNWFEERDLPIVKKYNPFISGSNNITKALELKIRQVENKIKKAEQELYAAEERAKDAICRANKAERVAKEATQAKTEAEQIAKNAKAVQLATLKKSKEKIAESDAARIAAEEKAEQEKEARIKAEANSHKPLEEIAEEIAAARVKLEEESKARIQAIELAERKKSDAAIAKAKLAESAKALALAQAKEAKAAELVANKKSKEAKAAVANARSIADNAMKAAEKAYKDMMAKSEEANKALKFAEEAQERVTNAELAKIAAEQRAETAEKKMQIAIDDKNKLQLMIYQRETELKEILKSELVNSHEYRKHKEYLQSNAVPSEQVNNIVSRKDSREKQLYLWNASSKGEEKNDEEDELQKLLLEKRRQEARVLNESRLYESSQKELESKVLSRNINISVKKILCDKDSLIINIYAFNNNNCAIMIKSINVDVILYIKSTGVKIFDKKYTFSGFNIDKLKSKRKRYSVRDINALRIIETLDNDVIDWESSKVIVNIVQRIN